MGESQETCQEQDIFHPELKLKNMKIYLKKIMNPTFK